jgi:small subunit ribosomal protein S5|tara:strand:- start:246 stop:794 length:549 start_codon:yes stop_codon:yes gene_type:complete
MVEAELQESVIYINRVAKVVKGGRNFSFTALVAVGDGNGSAGIGYGKGSEVPLAIQKAIENAKRDIHQIPMAGTTIVHTITGEHGSSKVLLKPASPGTGVIAGGAAREVLQVAGIKDILAKSLGSPTHLNVAKATMNGLLGQRTPDSVAKLRGKKPSEIAPKGLVDAYEKTKAERKVASQDV